ncbi:MAG: hypothetical protein AAGA30_21520 [Planctomycetota bacterium]
MPIEPRFSLRFLLSVILTMGCGLAAFVYLTTRPTELIRGDGATDIHGLSIDGPFLVRANAKPTIAFTINECTGPGYKRNIPFVVIVEHPNEVKFQSRLDCGTRQFVNIYNDVLMQFDGHEVHVIHNVNLNSFDHEPAHFADGTLAPLWDEKIEIYTIERAGNDPFIFDISVGRVFHVYFKNGVTEVIQIQIPIFDHTGIETMEIPELSERIYEWWNSTKP